jgi:ATP-dependent RNA helicase DHX8/PRP22
MIARRYADVQDKYNVDIIYSHPDQSITLEGTQDTVAAAEAMIEKIFNSVLDSVEEQSTRPKQGPYCVLCNHGVSDGFTLEVCGHSYCWDCLRFVARTALHAGREVKCAQCEDPLLSTEVYKFMSTTECSDKSTAHRRALERALNAGASNFCRCLTANCPGVWKKEASTLVWRCNSCLAAYCWSCKTDYETDEFGLSHLGKSCESYQLKRSQLAHRQSHARDQSCPLCLEPLSKLIGSNLSLCGACSAEVCCSCTNDKTRFGCDVGTCRRISDVTTASSTTE